ncbi:unnamed protein product [Callosobruchus maculatus]|uniref:Transmembrane protein 50A n=1 Tax=Callosobruchus maculatus TaxID=64391 RepID=A0A653C1X1_CALMS|nr:unnamed protein product [Callosobruchus maculatus]
MYQESKIPCVFLRNANAKTFNYIVCGVAGFLFFFGWWLMIDLNAQHRTTMRENTPYHLPGVFASIAMLLMNMIPTEYLYNSGVYTGGGCCTPFLCKLFLLVTLMASFGCLIGATYVMVNDFMLDPEQYQWPGYGVFFQTLCIFSSSVLCRFCRRGDAY